MHIDEFWAGFLESKLIFILLILDNPPPTPPPTAATTPRVTAATTPRVTAGMKHYVLPFCATIYICCWFPVIANQFLQNVKHQIKTSPNMQK